MFASPEADIFYSYSVFKSVNILRHCAVNLNVLALRMGALVDGAAKQNDVVILIKMSKGFVEKNFLNKSAWMLS